MRFEIVFKHLLNIERTKVLPNTIKEVMTNSISIGTVRGTLRILHHENLKRHFINQGSLSAQPNAHVVVITDSTFSEAHKYDNTVVVLVS